MEVNGQLLSPAAYVLGKEFLVMGELQSRSGHSGAENKSRSWELSQPLSWFERFRLICFWDLRLFQPSPLCLLNLTLVIVFQEVWSETLWTQAYLHSEFGWRIWLDEFLLAEMKFSWLHEIAAVYTIHPSFWIIIHERTRHVATSFYYAVEEGLWNAWDSCFNVR
jgi:hypothetical protein